MSIIADCHLHSSYSGDSDTPMEEMILCGIEKGLTTMCFTEHNDFGFPEEPGEPADRFILQPDPYLYDIIRYREKYADKIRILFGIELGLQPEVMRQNAVLAKSYDFDFIIGSSHICHGKDPYYPAFYEGRSEKEAYYEYFTSILENIKKFSNFDVYGHLDYVVRYGPSKDAEYTYEAYQDVLDDILKLLIEKGKGIEINTGGVKSGLKELHPCTAIVKRYHDLGGEIITIGSDAHTPDHIAAHFDRAEEVLRECGFKYYTIFEKRTPEFKRL
ncbi:MAG: histidinol-phosphatase HisJ family protein [Lachnospiraceae bacterium]|nr:histidinol-phosphatase HisJ family protein [Lachnospiraceae bacterium]